MCWSFMYVLSGEDDFHNVFEEIVVLKSQYHLVGRYLGVPLSQLDAIRINYHLSTDQALAEVLLVWLRQGYNVERFGPPTWRRLVEAVDSPSGGSNHALAMAIASRHVFGMCSIVNKKYL